MDILEEVLKHTEQPFRISRKYPIGAAWSQASILCYEDHIIICNNNFRLKLNLNAENLLPKILEALASTGITIK